jgi:RNA polymerase sigma-70 factor (ECF subfamily)
MGTTESKSADTDVPPSADAGVDPLPDTQRAVLVLLFNKYRGALLRHLERLVHSREDAAELMQETYLRVFDRIQTSRFEAAARAYLFHTATNLARDHFRRQRFRAHDRLDELTEADFLASDPPPEQTIAADEVLTLLRRSILELPPTTRAVFLKARVQNLGYSRIAAELNLSTRTVERRMAEAMEFLCKRIRGAE